MTEIQISRPIVGSIRLVAPYLTKAICSQEGARMHQDLIDEAFRAANRMAADRGISLDGTALMRAVLAVAGEGDRQNEPEEIAEDAMELLGKGNGVSSSRRGRRPF